MCRERIKETVALNDLRVYYRKMGCLYFVVYMSEDGSETEIFYVSLYPSKVKEYLELASQKGNKNSISIPCLRLEKESRELYSVCKQFSFEVRKQGSGLGQIVSHSIAKQDFPKIKKITATAVGEKTPYDFLKKISMGEVVFYASIDDSDIQYPIQISYIKVSANQIVKEPLYVGDKQYYSFFHMKTTVTTPDAKGSIQSEVFTVRLSENVVLFLEKSNVSFEFQFNTDIVQLRKDAEFMLDLLKKKEFFILGKRVQVYDFQLDPSFIDSLQKVIEIEQILQEIDCKVLIPFKKFTDDDKKQLDLLVKIQEGKVRFTTSGNRLFYVWEFQNKKWPLVISFHDNKIKFCSYAFNASTNLLSEEKDNFKEEILQHKYYIPNFLQLSSELQANLYYYDYKSVYEQVEKLTYNEDTEDILDIMALNLIMSYDINGDKKLLDIAAEILKGLLRINSGSVSHIINYCQIEIRKNGNISKISRQKLGKIEKNIYEKQKNGEETEEEIVFGYSISVLKQDIARANEFYSRLIDIGIDQNEINDSLMRKMHRQLMSNAKA